MKKLMAASALAILSASAFAAPDTGLSYSYLGGGYLKGTDRYGDANDYDLDGYFAEGSFKLNKNVYLFGEYRNAKTDTVAGSHFESDAIHYGLGAIIPVSDRFDIDAAGAGVHVSTKPRGNAAAFLSKQEEDGYLLQGLARYKLLPALEVNGGMRYSDVGEEDETTGLVGAVFNFTPAFGVTGRYEFGDNLNTYTVGGRFNF